MGLVEQEWLDTLGAVNVSDMQYVDFVETGRRLAAELRVSRGFDEWYGQMQKLIDSIAVDDVRTEARGGAAGEQGIGDRAIGVSRYRSTWKACV